MEKRVVNQKLTETMVTTALLSLLIHYPESGQNGKTIAILGQDYFSDMADENVNRRELEYALKEVRKKCAYFPKVKDFIDVIKAFRESPSYNSTPQVLMIAEDDSGPRTAQEIAQAQKNIKAIVQVALGEKTLEEALEVVKGVNVFTGEMDSESGGDQPRDTQGGKSKTKQPQKNI